jgi:hypothetical protein
MSVTAILQHLPSPPDTAKPSSQALRGIETDGEQYRNDTEQQGLHHEEFPLRFFADFNEVSLSVADFKELHVAPILDRSNLNTTSRKVVTGFL